MTMDGNRHTGSILCIEGLSKTYRGGKKAVSDLSLEVRPGEIHAFIGRNGAGKTTTLRAVVGLMDFDEGTITIDGHSIRDEPVLCKKSFAYVPDNPDLYDYISGMQYLDFVCDVYGVSEKDRRERIDGLSAAFGLQNELGNMIGSYSHGMKQKLAIIGALSHDPKLLILDEPFVGLDPESTHVLKTMMRRMCDSGCAVFFSTHVLDVAERLCDTVSVIKSGRLVASGSMIDVRGEGTLEDAFLELMADGQRCGFSFEDTALRGAASGNDLPQRGWKPRCPDLSGVGRCGGPRLRLHDVHVHELPCFGGIRRTSPARDRFRVHVGGSWDLILQGIPCIRVR